MMATKQSWGKLLGRMLLHGVILGVCVFVAVHAAMAREGERGGHTRTFLTVAGSIAVPVRMPPMTPHLTFVFEKVDPLSDAGAAAGPSAVCTVTNASTQYNASTGSFSSEIPIDACPTSMFDGANVWVTTVVRDGSMTGAELLRTERRPLNPVPYARYADQYGTPDCPVGYERTTDSTLPTGATLCRRGLDQVVKVGRGATAFWIDRYEASIWSNSAGNETPYGVGGTDNYPPSFPDNGQWMTPLYAVSRAGVNPSVSVTWFQAMEACRANGKRLPDGEEWLTAASGTVDPGAHNGVADEQCNTFASPAHAHNAEQGTACRSRWGAQDMIGNVSEWTADWVANTGAGTSRAMPTTNWGSMYSNDFLVNVASFVDRGDMIVGLPAAVLRGGSWNMGANAGIFTFDLNNSPTFTEDKVGFRCVIPR